MSAISKDLIVRPQDHLRLSTIRSLPFVPQVIVRLGCEWNLTRERIVFLNTHFAHLFDPYRGMMTADQCVAMTARVGKQRLFSGFEAKAKFLTENRDLLAQTDEVMVQTCFGAISPRKGIIQAYWNHIKKVGPEVHADNEMAFIGSMTKVFSEHSKEMAKKLGRAFDCAGIAIHKHPKIMVEHAKTYVDELAKKVSIQLKELGKQAEAAMGPEKIVLQYWHLQAELHASTLLKTHCQEVMQKMAQEHQEKRDEWSDFFYKRDQDICRGYLKHIAQLEQQMCSDIPQIAEDIQKQIAKNETALAEASVNLLNWKGYCQEEFGNTEEISGLSPTLSPYEATVHETFYQADVAPKQKRDMFVTLSERLAVISHVTGLTWPLANLVTFLAG